MKNRPGILGRLISHTLIIINLFAALWLGACYLSAYLSPAEYRYIQIFSLTTPFAIAGNAIFVFIWLLSHKKLRALISIISLTLCYKLIATVFAFNYFNIANDMSAHKGTVKVMHWNIHGMGLFNKNKQEKNDKEEILSTIEGVNPDILVMPEYYMYRDSSTKAIEKRIMKSCGFKEYHFAVDNTLGYHVVLGTILFSKFPIVNYKVHDLGNFIIMQQADVQVDGKMIRMFFLHLFSFNINDYEREYLHEVKESAASLKQLERSKPFIWKFNNSYAIRAGQAEKVAAFIKASPYPVLVAGDFNDLPASYTYTTIRDGLNDAFLDKGKGFGRTYNQILFTLRIDHIFYNPSALHLLGYEYPTIYASDHNPVIANFEVLK